MEDVVVVFGAGVDFRNAIYNFSKRNATALVSDADCVVGQLDDYFGACAHDEFVYAVVYYFFHKYIDAVIYVRSVAKTANVHAWSEPYVLKRRHSFD